MVLTDLSNAGIKRAPGGRAIYIELSVRGVTRIERQTEGGYDVVECELPALVTVTAGVNEPRYPTLKGIMQAKQKPLEQLSVSDLGLQPDEVKPTQEVVGIEPVPEREAGEILEDPSEAPAKVVEFLTKAKVI